MVDNIESPKFVKKLFNVSRNVLHQLKKKKD